MTEHKFTDEEIIKALECCCKDNYEGDCPKCPLQLNGNCNVILAEHALDLINRQKAEIESLNDMLCGKVTSLAASIEIAEAEERYKAYILSLKAEAIKEFADRLCEGRVSNDPVVIAVNAELKMTEGKE